MKIHFDARLSRAPLFIKHNDSNRRRSISHFGCIPYCQWRRVLKRDRVRSADSAPAKRIVTQAVFNNEVIELRILHIGDAYDFNFSIQCLVIVWRDDADLGARRFFVAGFCRSKILNREFDLEQLRPLLSLRIFFKIVEGELVFEVHHLFLIPIIGAELADL